MCVFGLKFQNQQQLHVLWWIFNRNQFSFFMSILTGWYSLQSPWRSESAQQAATNQSLTSSWRKRFCPSHVPPTINVLRALGSSWIGQWDEWRDGSEGDGTKIARHHSGSSLKPRKIHTKFHYKFLVFVFCNMTSYFATQGVHWNLVISSHKFYLNSHNICVFLIHFFVVVWQYMY